MISWDAQTEAGQIESEDTGRRDQFRRQQVPIAV